MAHGGYSKRRVNPAGGRRSKSALGPEKKPKSVTLKNQIRSVERMLLRKNLPAEVKEAQELKLKGLKEQQETQFRLAVERKIFIRDRKIKFFERRKTERRIRRLEKLQRTSSGQAQEAETSVQLFQLKEDLEYVRFFPKTEKYVSLFTGGEGSDIVDKRNKLRKQIKANIVAAAASGKDLEETGSEDDGLLDQSGDDFFLSESSDEADGDDEWTDKSTREQASSASGKATSGMSSDERNQQQISARALMPPPRPSIKSRTSSVRSQSRFGPSSSKSSKQIGEMSTSSNTSNGRTGTSFNTSNSNTSNSRSGTSFNTSNSNRSNSRSGTSFKARGSSNSTAAPSSNLSSNSDAHKPRRKRRPKKKKHQ